MPLKVSSITDVLFGLLILANIIFRVAKQVAQQIAQRAAFLVDQAIQEKVRVSRRDRLSGGSNLAPLFSNLSSSEPRERLDLPN
jgi:hypothetical protein